MLYIALEDQRPRTQTLKNALCTRRYFCALVLKSGLLKQQIPLSLGWAITIHKAEGQTLRRVYIDTQSKTFAPEMLYVALTRVKRLKDLVVVPFSKEFVNELHTKPVFKQRMFEFRRLLHLEQQTINKWDLNIDRSAGSDEMEVDDVEHEDDDAKMEMLEGDTDMGDQEEQDGGSNEDVWERGK